MNHFGWPFFSWETLWGVGVLLLAVVIAWALWRNATRNRANDRITEEATRRMYDDPDAYHAGGRERLNRQLDR